MNTKLNARYLRDVKNVTFHSEGIKVVFKGEHVPTYEGDLEGLRVYVKRHKAYFKESFVDKEKAGVFPAFQPTNKAQRKVLANKTGVTEKEVKDKVFTFYTRQQAVNLYKEMAEAGIKTEKKHWPYVAILDNTPV